MNTIVVVTLLLHKLATRLNSNLKAKLAAYRQMVSTTQYTGVGHMFAVTLARLSYAEVPEEIQGPSHRKLNDIGGTYHRLLALWKNTC